jgi:cytochrome P450
MNPSPAPGPAGWDLLRRLRRSQVNPLAEWMDARGVFGDVVRYRAGRLPVYLVSHPDDVQRVLQGNWRNYRKGVFNQSLVPLLGQGLLTNEAESWLAQRRLLQPAFHREHLRDLASIMAGEAEALVERWRVSAPSGEPVEVGPAMHRLTFRIASRALLGVRMDMNDLLGQSFATAIEHVNFRSRHPFAPPAWMPTRRNRRYQRVVEQLDGLIFSIIQERRKQDNKGGDILSLLLAARDAETGEAMNERQLRDEVLTFLVAGHETAANLLSWSWHLLAQHPEAGERLGTEANRVLGGRAARAEDVPQLLYARRVLEESLRLHPPSVVLPRQANGPDEIGGYPVPEDAAVLISQYIVHRHPEFWDEPEQFDPERFLPERVAGRHRFAFIPFGGGPRVCIGREFALMEGQIALATLARAFDVEPVPGRTVVPEVAVTLRPRDLCMRVHPR